jgi:hypothetical protein
MGIEQEKMRRKHLIGCASLQVVNAVLFGDGSYKERLERFERAKKTAKSKGRTRVYVEDWEESK